MENIENVITRGQSLPHLKDFPIVLFKRGRHAEVVYGVRTYGVTELRDGTPFSDKDGFHLYFWEGYGGDNRIPVRIPVESGQKWVSLTDVVTGYLMNKLNNIENLATQNNNDG